MTIQFLRLLYMFNFSTPTCNLVNLYSLCGTKLQILFDYESPL